MTTTKKLSERQSRILEFIKHFMSEHQFPPTVRDIQAGCEISSTSVVDYNLHILQRHGYLRRLPEVSRGKHFIELPPTVRDMGEHAALAAARLMSRGIDEHAASRSQSMAALPQESRSTFRP